MGARLGQDLEPAICVLADQILHLDPRCGQPRIAEREAAADAPLVDGIPQISVQELKRRLDAKEDVFVLDVRESHEVQIVNIGAPFIPLGDLPKRVGELMFPLAQQWVERVVLVTDEAILAAQRALWSALRVVAEPGGAAAFAALLSGAYQPAPGERLGILVCGANTTAVAL